MGLGCNDPWVESHMWPQQTWCQRWSSRGNDLWFTFLKKKKRVTGSTYFDIFSWDLDKMILGCTWKECTLPSHARLVFGGQLYKNNARSLLSCILSIANSDWLQHAQGSKLTLANSHFRRGFYQTASAKLYHTHFSATRISALKICEPHQNSVKSKMTTKITL